ncbi:MAG: triphosphoribosyl-dephospho-CoA synthase [Promethearchaeota archaeon]
MNWPNDEDTIAQCGSIAALLEVSGYPKPGNIHRTRDFPKTRYEHFLASSVAIIPTLREIAYYGRSAYNNKFGLNELNLGASILKAVKNTQFWQYGGNTNLGIILLFVPLACAAGMLIDHPHPSIQLFRENLELIIKNSTNEDTIKLYDAIRLANPGGLGTVNKFDLKNTSPKALKKENINLYDIFKISSVRDNIAKEWITQFQITFEKGYPFFLDVFHITEDINISTIYTYLKILGDIPDTLISRKYGVELAERISNKAKQILKASLKEGFSTKYSIELVWNFDLELRNKKKINPGTSADLTAAAIMVALLKGMRF